MSGAEPRATRRAPPADADQRSALRAAFATDGFVRVDGAVALADVGAMRERVWATLAAHGIVHDDPRTWVAGGGLGLVELVGALRPGPGSEEVLWQIGRAAVFAPLAAALGRAVDHVFGPGIWAPMSTEHGGLAAPNFPIPGVAWNVPHQAWHVDEPTAAAQDGSWGLLGFAFLDEVTAGGGATVVIAGSHRRLGRLAVDLATGSGGGLLTSEPAIAALRHAEPWFDELFRPGDPDPRQRRFLRDGHASAGIPLRVVELTGAPGDLVLMDPRCLHTVSANVSHRARLTMRMTCARG